MEKFVIAKCCYYKDKENWLKNSRQLKGTPFSLSDDFSKATLAVRKELVSRAKEAKECNDSIKNFRVNYRRLVVTYENKSTNATFFRGFNLEDICASPTDWHRVPQYQGPRRGGQDGYQG